MASTKKSKETPPKEVWSTEILRITLFHRLGPQKEANTEWWEKIVGEPPENVSMKPREGGYEVSGPFAGGVLILKASAQRIDWLFTPQVSPDNISKGLDIIGEFPVVLESISKPIKDWLASVEGISRIAFGTINNIPVASHIEGYDLLSKYLPYVDIDSKGSSDFHYSINRPRNTKRFGGLLINRLSKWGVVRLKTIPFSLIGGSSPIAIGQPFGEETYNIRLELDINTDGNHTDPFDSKQAPNIMDFLVTQTQEILEKGDVK